MVVCALLGAKFPSMMALEQGVSVYGGLVGGGVAAFALLMANLFFDPIHNFEMSESTSRLFPLRVGTLAFFVTITAVTAYLYTHFGWLLILVRIAVIIGAISVFAALVMAWKKGGSDV